MEAKPRVRDTEIATHLSEAREHVSKRRVPPDTSRGAPVPEVRRECSVGVIDQDESVACKHPHQFPNKLLPLRMTLVETAGPILARLFFVDSDVLHKPRRQYDVKGAIRKGQVQGIRGVKPGAKAAFWPLRVSRGACIDAHRMQAEAVQDIDRKTVTATAIEDRGLPRMSTGGDQITADQGEDEFLHPPGDPGGLLLENLPLLGVVWIQFEIRKLPAL